MINDYDFWLSVFFVYLEEKVLHIIWKVLLSDFCLFILTCRSCFKYKSIMEMWNWMFMLERNSFCAFPGQN